MNFLEKEKFDPGIISLFFHPFYFVRKEIMAFLKKKFSISLRTFT